MEGTVECKRLIVVDSARRGTRATGDRRVSIHVNCVTNPAIRILLLITKIISFELVDESYDISHENLQKTTIPNTVCTGNTVNSLAHFYIFYKEYNTLEATGLIVRKNDSLSWTTNDFSLSSFCFHLRLDHFISHRRGSEDRAIRNAGANETTRNRSR